MGLMRRTCPPPEAARIAADIRAIDHALIELVAGTDALTLRTAGTLVDMQRRLRRLRYEIEVECGVEAGAGPSGGGSACG